MSSNYVRHFNSGSYITISIVNSRRLYKRCNACVEYIRKWKDKKYNTSKMARWAITEAINRLLRIKAAPSAIPKVKAKDRKIQTLLIKIPTLNNLDNMLAELNSGRGQSIDRSDFIRWALDGACSKIEEIAIQRKREDEGL